MSDTSTETLLDSGIVELIDIARSACVYFEIINDKLTVRAVDPNWRIWAPVRYLLDEIGMSHVERIVRRYGRNGLRA